MSKSIVYEKLAYESPEGWSDRGFSVKAFYLLSPEGEALIKIFKDGKQIRWFLFPAYKIWNISAHFSDIVDSELRGDKVGYDMAAWTGFSVLPTIEETTR